MAGMDFGASDAIQGNVNTDQYGTVKTKKNISQAGIDKIIYDIMSSDQGLASLGSLENASGGYRSTTKTLMAQDLMTKLAGEIAVQTAETEQTTDMKNDKSTPMNRFFGEPQSLSDSTDTVICTELVRQGKFSKDLYKGGHEHFLSLPRETVIGYQFWAKPIAQRMRTSERLSSFMLPIVKARYEQIVSGRKSFLGSLTIYIGQPICFLIGTAIKFFGANHARTQQSA